MGAGGRAGSQNQQRCLEIGSGARHELPLLLLEMWDGGLSVERLKVALVHRDSPRNMADRMVGYWSYPVPEFEWDHFPVGKGFRIDKDELAARGYELIVYEDAKIYGEFVGEAGLPVCYVVVDSTLSEGHYRHRVREAAQCDLILVDWDGLERFEHLGKPVARFSHCVNDEYFRDLGLERDIDVGSFQGDTPARKALEERLAVFCRQRGYRFEWGTRGWDDYARDMASCKVVLNLNRNPSVRGHRIFDAMACGACLVTSPVPDVPWEPRKAGRDYVEFADFGDLAVKLDSLLQGGLWREVAANGERLIKRWHTWAIRAQQLRWILENTVLAE